MPELTNSHHPLASVIIPNYNHARYLPDAIESILRQDYPTVEIIVVDDGSSDNSREVVAPYGERVRYIWQENQGLSAARNTGIKAALGEFIGLLDADDMFESTFLSTMITTLEAHPTACGVFCGYQFVDENNRLLPQIEVHTIPDIGLYKALLDGNFLVPESMFLRRSCYAEAGDFDTSLTACEDWDMWLRVSKRRQIVAAPHILTRHRVLPGSMSTDPQKMLDNRLAVLKKHLGPQPKPGDNSDNLVRRAYARAYLGSSVEYLQYGYPPRARECLAEIAALYPTLLTELDTYYQLACGDQPKGSMGDFTSLDVRRNGRILLDMLDQLFNQPETRQTLAPYRQTAIVLTNHALALLSYGKREYRHTRYFVREMARASTAAALQRPIVTLWLKSFLRPEMIARLKGLRRSLLSN